MSHPIEYTQVGMPYLPYVNFKISNAFEHNYISTIGEIDTGSPITVIQESLRQSLNLQKVGIKEFRGFNSAPQEFDTYFVYVRFGTERIGLLEVISQDDDKMSEVLFGRDLINLWKMTLDGSTYNGDFNIWSNNPVDVNVP